MNSPKYNLVSSIKWEVEERNKRKYLEMKEQKVINYYGLYQDKIVFIQRWCRKFLTKKLRKMETLVLAKINKNHILQCTNQQKKLRLIAVKQKTTILLEQKSNQFLRVIEDQIAQKLKRVVNGTLDCAEKLAQNNGRSKYLISEIKSYVNKGEQLQGEISALKFEYQCHKKRKLEWQDKLFTLKQNVMNESLKALELRNKIKQMSTIKMSDTMSTQSNVLSN